MGRPDARQRICLVTEELAIGEQSGGIGGAFLELARLLARENSVDVLYCPVQFPNDDKKGHLESYFSALGIRLSFLKSSEYCWEEQGAAVRSYSVFRTLLERGIDYDFVHFHDYKGLGYYTLCARDQGLGFEDTIFVVQLHGPTRWTIETNEALFTHQDQLKIDFLERGSIARADYAISPSAYLLEWMRGKEWDLPQKDRCLVVKNVCTGLLGLPGVKRSHLERMDSHREDRRTAISEIVMFGRHEYRKGFTVFCEALDHLNKELSERAVKVTFLGKFGRISEEHSGVILAQKAAKWGFPVSVLPFCDRHDAAEYLVSRPGALAVIPSPAENSPYTVLEAVALDKPVITSTSGGASELLDERVRDEMTCEMTAEGLAEAIRSVILNGISAPILAEALADTETHWLDFHRRAEQAARGSDNDDNPLVSICITHFERPMKLFEAIASIARQSYKNIELIVVDDGSPSSSTRDALKELRPMIERLGGQIIFRENGYLGAARNTGAAAATGEYLCFLDDDDIAFPDMVEKLVGAAKRTKADIVNCLNVFMPESRRQEAWPLPQQFQNKVSYIPLGGPLSLVPVENTLGAATALISRRCFHALNGYTEIKGVGHEDFEFFARALQAGFKLEVCPLPLYLYEVDRPSMISGTSAVRNFRRVFKSVDVAKNADAWGDLIQLNTGRAGTDHGINRRLFLQKRDANSKILGAIDRAAESKEVLEHLSSYASAIKSPAMERAFRQAVDTIRDGKSGQASVDLSGLTVQPIEHFIGETVGVQPQAGIREDAEVVAHLGTSKFTEMFCAAISKKRVVSTGDLTRLRMALTGTFSKSDTLSILDALRGRNVMSFDIPLLLEVMMFMALQGGETSSSARFLQLIIDIESDEYLRANPDVAAASAEGGVTSALDHYLNYGHLESRVGFQRLHASVRTLNGLTGSDMNLKQFIEFAKGAARPIDIGKLLSRFAATKNATRQGT